LLAKFGSVCLKCCICSRQKNRAKLLLTLISCNGTIITGNVLFSLNFKLFRKKLIKIISSSEIQMYTNIASLVLQYTLIML
jgi:hypothetical protein